MFNFPSNHTTENLAILDKKTQILFLGDALCGKIVDYDFIKDKEIIKEQQKQLVFSIFSSIMEFHVPQPGHLPIHFEDSFPHSLHTNTVLLFT